MSGCCAHSILAAGMLGTYGQVASVCEQVQARRSLVGTGAVMAGHAFGIRRFSISHPWRLKTFKLLYSQASLHAMDPVLAQLPCSQISCLVKGHMNLSHDPVGVLTMTPSSICASKEQQLCKADAASPSLGRCTEA